MIKGWNMQIRHLTSPLIKLRSVLNEKKISSVQQFILIYFQPYYNQSFYRNLIILCRSVVKLKAEMTNRFIIGYYDKSHDMLLFVALHKQHFFLFVSDLICYLILVSGWTNSYKSKFKNK